MIKNEEIASHKKGEEMNKQLPRTIFLLTVLTSCALIGCSHTRVNESESNNPTESSSTFLTDESPSMESKLNDKNEESTESNGMNQEPPIDDSAFESFGINDILVSGNPFGEDRPFMLIDINDITLTRDTLKKTESTEYANGHFIYWEDEGIIYVTHSTGTNLISIILGKSGLALNCGLKIGMREAEIQSLGLTFEKFTKEDLLDESKSIAFASNFIRDEKNPINTEDFDSLYVYVGEIPEEELIEYEINTTSCVSIVALIKNEAISKIILEMPTAG